MTPRPRRDPPSTRCPHRVTPTSRHRAAAAFVAQASRAAGRKTELKEISYG